MKKILLYFFAFFYFMGLGYAQSDVVKGAADIHPEKGQSYYVQQIPLKDNLIPQIKLTHIQTKDIAKLPAAGLDVSNSFQPDVLIATARKQKYASVRIPLYLKKGQQLKQLLGYDLSVQYPEGTAHVAAKPTGIYPQHSVLASGDWYKIAVSKRGIYKIDYQFLQTIGVNPAQVNPNDIRIYGNGGTVIPERVSDSEPDSLIQNAIYVHASGNTFAQGDYVLFYANGPVLWSKDSANSEFYHTNNYYADKSYYFLNFDEGAGLRVQSENANGNASQTYTSFNNYAVYDEDSINIAATGRTWWSNPMYAQTAMPTATSLSMNLGAVTDTVFAKVHVGNVNDASGSSIAMKVNGQSVQYFTLSGTSSSTYYADQEKTFSFEPGTPNLNITFNYTPAGNGVGYLDYIELNYKSPLTFSGNELTFRNWASAALPSGELAAYHIGNAPSNLKVWDITNPLKPVDLNGTVSGSTYQFTRSGGRLHEFVAFKGTQFSQPEFIEKVANQDLHGLPETDLLIITNDSLKPAAEELADFHRAQGLSVTVATVDKIYNEFSSGGQDIGGIRNFIKMFYDRAQNEQEMIKNVLLFGAASYDYKGRQVQDNTNFVPTYETLTGDDDVHSFSTDDYFAILDSGETVLSTNNLLDVGIGRIPAINLEEAEDAVKKIKIYTSPASFGPWKNVVTFVADDHDYGFGNLNHLDDCELIDKYFYQDNRKYNLYKIYADAFNKVAEAGGSRYPDVNRAIDDRIFNGTFLMSYSGHGNATRWSHEAILTPDDYDNWTNIDKLPIMFTGTCDFGRFDNPDLRYAGVKLMMNPDGGCIAIITTTQSVFQSGNMQMGQSFMQHQFSELPGGGFYSLGEALRQAKNAIPNGFVYNKIKFVLLGDPALRLPIPKLKVETDSLLQVQNGQHIPNDTLEALGSYILKGSVSDEQGALQTDFNGTVYVTIFDKPTTIQTVNTVPDVTPSFKVQNNVVAKIKAKVINGRFAADFVVPKDINYDLGLGKISYYANSDTEDARGLDTSKYVGGFNQQATPDDQPPTVKAYIDNDKFQDGGITGPNPRLYVKLFDDHGINVSGGAVGHNLIAILDDDIQHPFVLNNYYQTVEGDFRSGYVYYPLYNLPDGKHTITVRAWDTYNNSGEGTVSFVVKNKDKGFIGALYNYPNPVYHFTHIVFQHNQAGEKMAVTLQLFNTAGSMKWSYHKEMQPEGNFTEILWDGTGNNGEPLAKGVYFLKLSIKTDKGVKATAYHKLVLLKN